MAINMTDKIEPEAKLVDDAYCGQEVRKGISGSMRTMAQGIDDIDLSVEERTRAEAEHILSGLSDDTNAEVIAARTVVSGDTYNTLREAIAAGSSIPKGEVTSDWDNYTENGTYLVSGGVSLDNAPHDNFIGMVQVYTAKFNGEKITLQLAHGMGQDYQMYTAERLLIEGMGTAWTIYKTKITTTVPNIANTADDPEGTIYYVPAG